LEYRTKPVGTNQSHVVVIHCSDPRYQPHFQDFLHSVLELTHYGLIAIPGGPEHLSPSERSDALRSQGAAWFDFMSKLMAAQRCILIGHADCRWYVANRIEPDESRLKEHVWRDLISAREEIQRRFPKLRVELYFAQIEGEQATFIEVAAPALTSPQSAKPRP
jgi:hypothetical protein